MRKIFTLCTLGRQLQFGIYQDWETCFDYCYYYLKSTSNKSQTLEKTLKQNIIWIDYVEYFCFNGYISPKNLKIPEILCGFASGVIRLLVLVKMQFRPTSSSTQCTVGKISTFLDFQFFLLQLGFEPLWFTTYKISQEFEYHGG